MSEYQKIDSYLENNIDKSLEELGKLVAQPSISAQGIGLKECAGLVADMLRARGFTNHGYRRCTGRFCRAKGQK